MKIFSSKKRAAAIGAVTAATLVGGTVAFAYWTSSGGGTGTAAVGTDGGWTVTQTSESDTDLVPDGPAKTITYSVQNLGSGVQSLTGVKVKVEDGWESDLVDDSLPVCDKSDFKIDAAAVGAEYTDPEAAGSFTGLQVKTGYTVAIQLVNKSSANQDNCKNVDVPLTFTAY